MGNMLRMSEEAYEQHQARVRNWTGPQIARELERAAGWVKSGDPRLVAGGEAVLGQVSNLLSMDSINRHQATIWNGERYDSKIEARRHQVLIMRERAGLIRKVRHHPAPIALMIADIKVGSWRPDFEYFEPALGDAGAPWVKVWEDIKGFTSRKVLKNGKNVTQVNPAWRAFKFKAKIISALYPEVRVRVVTRDQVLL